jgi:hypothetical protein
MIGPAARVRRGRLAVLRDTVLERFLLVSRGPRPCRCATVQPCPAWEPEVRRIVERLRDRPAVTGAAFLTADLSILALLIASAGNPNLQFVAVGAAALFLTLLVRVTRYVERTQRSATDVSPVAARLTNLAARLAGRRRGHLREAWQSDLDRPRDSADDGGRYISDGAKVIYAVGLVKAALRYRVDDVTAWWWRLADSVLISRFWSRLLLGGPCVAAVAAIVHREGFYGLVVNAENLLAIGSVSAGLVYGGRKFRRVAPKIAAQQEEART